MEKKETVWGYPPNSFVLSKLWACSFLESRNPSSVYGSHASIVAQSKLCKHYL